jgi:hypothetical protein
LRISYDRNKQDLLLSDAERFFEFLERQDDTESGKRTGVAARSRNNIGSTEEQSKARDTEDN